MNDNTILLDTPIDPTTYARGCYQRELIRGRRRWSGADLAGAARSYAGRYARSRAGLVARLQSHGITCRWAHTAHDRFVLVVGDGDLPADLAACDAPRWAPVWPAIRAR